MLPDHIIQGIAVENLSPSDRRHLCDSSRVFRRALLSIVSAEGARRHIPLVVTLSGVHRVLAEIGRAPAAEQAPLLTHLASRNGKMTPAHRGAAVQAIVNHARRLPAEQQARIIAGFATTLRFTMKATADGGLRNPWLNAEKTVWEAALKLPDNVRGLAAGPLLQRHAVSLLLPFRLPMWIEELHKLSPSGRSELLTGLAEAYVKMEDTRPNDADTDGDWGALLHETLALPDDLRAKPLYAVASIEDDLTPKRAVRRWNRLYELASTRSDEDKVAIYAGLANLLDELPGESRKPCFDKLFACCEQLPLAGGARVLKRFASMCVGGWFNGYGADRIIDVSIARLPPMERLIPLRVLLTRVDCDHNMLNRYRAQILRKTQDFPMEERAQVLGYCAQEATRADDVDSMVVEAGSLPAPLRRWFLAGVTHDGGRIQSLGGVKWIDSNVMPLMHDMPPASRTDVLANLAIMAFGGLQDYSLFAKEIQLTPSTWATVERYISELPPAEVVRLLGAFIRCVEQPETLAWAWALKQTNVLPPGLRAPLLRKLIRVRSMESMPRSAPLHKLLPAIASLPAFYRAYPLQAVNAAVDKVQALGDFVGYWKAVFKIVGAKRGLPREDRF